MQSVEIPIRIIGASEIPSYAHDTDAGFDLQVNKDVNLWPGAIEKISCGFQMAIPDEFAGFGLFGLIVPRSSTGKIQVGLANTVGVIDSGYRGEIQLILQNNSQTERKLIKKGTKIVQMLIVPYIKATMLEVDDLNDTSRGVGGFGSTTKNKK